MPPREVPEVVALLKAKLSVERAGFKLDAAIINMLVEYVVASGITDANDVLLTDVLMYAGEAWSESHDGKALPGIQVNKIKMWIANSTARLPADAPTVEAVGSLDEEQTVSLFGKRHPTDVELDKLAEDVKIQGMEGMHLIRMSAALELGRLPPISDVFGVLFYGSDIRMSEMAKKQRKAGIDTLQKVLEKADDDVRAILAEHFANVVREYSAEGLVKEASRVTAWWADTQSISQDNAILVKYISEYFRRFPGRGLPVTIDPIIALKVTNAGGGSGAGSELIKELKLKAKAAESDAAERKREVSQLRTQFDRLVSEVNKLKNNSQKKGQGRDDITCHHCGEPGHIQPNCPKKKAEDAARKEEESKDK